jgi:hypothetical protein
MGVIDYQDEKEFDRGDRNEKKKSANNDRKKF